MQPSGQLSTTRSRSLSQEAIERPTAAKWAPLRGGWSGGHIGAVMYLPKGGLLIYLPSSTGDSGLVVGPGHHP